MRIQETEEGGRVRVVARWGGKGFDVQPPADCSGFSGWTPIAQWSDVGRRSRGQVVITGNVVLATAGTPDSAVVQVRVSIYAPAPIVLAQDVIGIAQGAVRVPIDLTEWTDQVLVEARQLIDGVPSGDATKVQVSTVSAQLVLED